MSVLDDLTTRDKIAAFLKENKGPHSSISIKNALDLHYAGMHTRLVRLEKEGLIVRDRIARQFFWVWAAHIPKGMSVRNYIAATFQKPMRTTIQARHADLAGLQVRDRKILGVAPEIIRILPVTRVWDVEFQWPENMLEVIEAREEEIQKQVEERKKQRG